MRIGFDLDGVLAEIRPAELELIREVPIDRRLAIETDYYATLRPLLDARAFVRYDDTPIVVTARPTRVMDVTMRWLKRYYPGWPVHFVGTEYDWQVLLGHAETRRRVAQAKAMELDTLGIDVYFEDDPVIVELLRGLARIPIVQYGGWV